MYNPKGNGKEKTVREVQFTELEPPTHLRGIVHRFLELNTHGPLPEDYRFHALPDACTYIVFDQLDRKIRFLPGVWQGNPDQMIHGMVNTPYVGDLPLIDINQRLSQQGFGDSQILLSELVEVLIDQKLVAPNPITERIFQHLDDIVTVADMADLSNLSPRQLQRTLKRTTGYAPHDFLKILRLQQSLNGGDPWSYADQSHFIHSFRKATGYTPGKYARKFDV